MMPLNPLTMPLQGWRVIEASAGTGKTWTLAALYVRLVLGHTAHGMDAAHALLPPQILVMTFTQAATAELRARIRSRLAQAALFFGQHAHTEADAFLHDLRASIPAHQWPNCAQRLDMAAQWMDDAAIHTIHGWSHRMLKSHALGSSGLFAQQRLEDAAQLELQAVQDYWRQWFYPLPAHLLEALRSLGNTPEELLLKLRPLWTESDKAPTPIAAPAADPSHLLNQWADWQSQRDTLQAQARAAWTAQLVDCISAAAASKALKDYRSNWLPGWLDQMAQWQAGAPVKPDTLQRFTLRRLKDCGWQQASEQPAFALIEALHNHLQQEPPITAPLLAHAACTVQQAYRQAKSRRAQFDFSDLLRNLYQALQAPDGHLASAIRAQFPVALVDEFQDTDPWQYGALRKIYDPTDTDSGGLIMIGDPKQAIYGFRGADLQTYLHARQQAQSIHTLNGNHRSTAGLVAAVNRVFGNAVQPFGEIAFEPVLACNRDLPALQLADSVQTAMTVWHLPRGSGETKEQVNTALAHCFATHIVRLLNQRAAQPGDMAVLVRDGNEARLIRQALAQRAVPSVYFSERDSVFASEQASDLWRILRALASPRDSALVRAAVATRLWGCSWVELENLLLSEAAWDRLTEQFLLWQSIWQRQGVLPMLQRLLHDQHIPTRLLKNATDTQGERALTNLLHLGELLQAVSLHLQGEAALLRYLEDQLRDPQASGDQALLRLESDARRVQVMTLHKSKGLQYPLVFLPFVSNVRNADADQPEQVALRLAEEMRLLYVGLTRARQALWLGVAQMRGDLDGPVPVARSAISRLLGRTGPDDLLERLQDWVCPHITVQPAPPAHDARHAAPGSSNSFRPALTAQRPLASYWWNASFSALTRGVATHTPESAQEARWQDARMVAQLQEAAQSIRSDDVANPGRIFDTFPAGSSYGTLLHDLLEWQAHNGWPARSAQADGTWQSQLQRKAQLLKLDADQLALLGCWLTRIVSTPLALPMASNAFVLGALSARQYWAEMAFCLSVVAFHSTQLEALIGQHIHPGCARPGLPEQTLQGMLTGFMDLVLEFEGRYYVLDYKSNKLANYAGTTLQQAMLAHRYDVQATLYLLALHRLLKARLPGYDYEQHVGGALYWFLRGIDQQGAGLYVQRPPQVLIETLDAALAHGHGTTGGVAT